MKSQNPYLAAASLQSGLHLAAACNRGVYKSAAYPWQFTEKISTGWDTASTNLCSTTLLSREDSTIAKTERPFRCKAYGKQVLRIYLRIVACRRNNRQAR